MIPVLATIVVLLAVAAALALPVIRRRRAATVDEAAELEQLMASVTALPAPDELYQAPKVTKSTRRRYSSRPSPRARKRRSGRWA